jgi:hypothetical protein
VTGCPVTGRLSRWPLLNGQISGPEQIVINGGNNALGPYCCQFSTHSVTSVVVAPDGNLAVAWGDGAAFTTVDVGQLGNNACNDNPGYQGAYRVQDPQRLNGKIVSVNPQTLAWNVISTGHRNPWRLTTYNGMLLESETGWYSAEEINHIQAGKNYGWPCFEGPNRSPEYIYHDQDFPYCNTIANTPPLYHYTHPVPPPPGNVASISAVGGGVDGRIYFADYTQGWIKAFNAATLQDEVLIANGVFAVEIKYTPAGT